MTGCCSYDSLSSKAFGKGSIAQRLVPFVNFFGIFGACTGYVRIVLTLVPLLGFLPWSIRQGESILISAVLFLILAFPFCLLQDISR
jgi:hypothetical protein